MFFNAPAVEAALHGRVLILEGASCASAESSHPFDGTGEEVRAVFFDLQKAWFFRVLRDTIGPVEGIV